MSFLSVSLSLVSVEEHRRSALPNDNSSDDISASALNRLMMGIFELLAGEGAVRCIDTLA